MLGIIFCLLAAQDRSPIPDAGAQKQAEKLVRDLFKDEYAKKTPSDKQALAKKLLKQSTEVGDEAATRYVLLREAADLASDGGDPATALNAIDEMAKTFQVERARLKHSVLTSAAKTVKTPEEAASLATSFLRLADEAAASDDFDTANKALDAGSGIAKRSKELTLSPRFQAKGKEISELKAKYDKAKKARESLASNPDDPGANLSLGYYESLTKGNWTVGLPLLAKGSDPSLKDLAAKDLSDPSDPTLQAAVGDGWWDLGEKEAGNTKERLRQRALQWYQRAAPTLAGLAKAKVDKRLKQLLVGQLARGSWVEVNDPKHFSSKGKVGDPVEVAAPLVVALEKLPPGEFDGLSVRVRLKPGQPASGIIAFEPKKCGTWIDAADGTLSGVRANEAGDQWRGHYTAPLSKEEEFLLSIFVSGGEYTVHVNGEEKYRTKTTQERLSGLNFDISKGVMLFDQIRFRRKE